MTASSLFTAALAGRVTSTRAGALNGWTRLQPHTDPGAGLRGHRALQANDTGVPVDPHPRAFAQPQAHRALGIALTREAAADKRAASTIDDLYSPGQLSFHGGEILATTTVQSIFWGPSWAEGDTKVVGVDKFFAGMANTPYADTVSEWTGTNGQVSNSITSQGHVIDNTPIPPTIPPADLNNPSDPGFVDLVGEVCLRITNPVADGYYPIFIDNLRPQSAQYCAFHSFTTCQNVPVTYAFHFNVDGDFGCDNSDTTTGLPQGLSALLSIAGHEISETRSDPRQQGWYNPQTGQENSDQCAYTYGVNPVIFNDGIQYKIQGNWGNNAGLAGIGYSPDNRDPGCIDGGNAITPTPSPSPSPSPSPKPPSHHLTPEQKKDAKEYEAQEARKGDHDTKPDSFSELLADVRARDKQEKATHG